MWSTMDTLLPGERDNAKYWWNPDRTGSLPEERKHHTSPGALVPSVVLPLRWVPTGAGVTEG